MSSSTGPVWVRNSAGGVVYGTVVTLVNLNASQPRTVVVQAGGYGEHQFVSAEIDGKSIPINARDFTVELAPGAGAKLSLAMKRYANQPTAKFPWNR